MAMPEYETRTYSQPRLLTEQEQYDLEGMYKQFVQLRNKKIKQSSLLWGFIAVVIIWAWIGTSFTPVYFISGLGNIFNFIIFDLYFPLNDALTILFQIWRRFFE